MTNKYRKKTNNTATDESINLDEFPRLLSIKEAASILRISYDTLVRWRKKGFPYIRSIQRGNRFFYTNDDLKTFLKNLYGSNPK
ncbi:MAG: helix-turn-helix domain-containing protein [Alphaproteobacteria bacterium]|nr:helix-turn-helix domain-containing protein [Alphaproteobacteria bacterium]